MPQPTGQPSQQPSETQSTAQEPTQAQLEELVNQPSPVGLVSNSEALQGIGGLLYAPLHLQFDTTKAAAVTRNIHNIFKAPLDEGFQDASAKKPLNLEELAKENNQDASAKIQEILKTLEEDTSPAVSHFSAVTKIFQELDQKIKENSHLNTSLLEVDAKARFLISLYYDKEKALKAQLENDKKALDTWVDTHTDGLKKIYADFLQTDEGIRKLKENMKDRLDKQTKAELALFDNLKQEMLNSCSNVAELHRAQAAAHLNTYLPSNPDGSATITFNSPRANTFDNDKLVTYLRIEIPITKTKDDKYEVNIDFGSEAFKNLSAEQKENVIYDIALGFREKGCRNIQVTKLLKTIDGRTTNDPAYTKSLAQLIYKGFFRAGLEVDIENQSKDDTILKFARELRATQSYAKLRETNPFLATLFEKSAKQDLKTYSINTLGNRAPVLTTETIKQLREKDWSTVNTLEDDLDAIQPGLSTALSSTLNNESHAGKLKILREIRADMISNPLLKEALVNTVTEDLQSVTNLLSKEQIGILNRMDFTNCHTVDDVIKAIEHEVIGLHGNKLPPMAQWLYLSDSGRSKNFLTAFKDKLEPQKLQAAQQKSLARALYAVTAPGLEKELEDHHTALKGNDLRKKEGLITKIDSQLQAISDQAVSKNKTVTEIFNTHSDPLAEKGKNQTQLIQDYHAVFWHGEKVLENLLAFGRKAASETLGVKSNRFNYQQIYDDFNKMFQERIQDVDAAITCLKKAGVANEQVIAINRDLLPKGLRNDIDFKGLQKKADELSAKKEEFYQKMAEATGYNFNPGHIVERQPSQIAEEQNNIVVRAGSRG